MQEIRHNDFGLLRKRRKNCKKNRLSTVKRLSTVGGSTTITTMGLFLKTWPVFSRSGPARFLLKSPRFFAGDRIGLLGCCWSDITGRYIQAVQDCPRAAKQGRVMIGYLETGKPLKTSPAASQENGVKIAPARIGQGMRKAPPDLAGLACLITFCDVKYNP